MGLLQIPHATVEWPEMTVFLLAMIAGSLVGLLFFAAAIVGLLAEILDSLSDEGFRTEAALQTGFQKWSVRVADRMKLWRRYPTGRIPRCVRISIQR